jgi:hypothetical protein
MERAESDSFGLLDYDCYLLKLEENVGGTFRTDFKQDKTADYKRYKFQVHYINK